MVTASEFVKMRLGDYRDADVAGLFQQIAPQHTEEDMTDAIRKNRTYLKKNYAPEHAAILEDLRSQSPTEIFDSEPSSLNYALASGVTPPLILSRSQGYFWGYLRRELAE